MRDMRFLEKIAVWLLLFRLKRQIKWLAKYEDNCTTKQQFTLMHKAYVNLQKSVVDYKEWGYKFKPVMDFDTTTKYINNKVKTIEAILH